jgi:hypothetical protein
VVCAHVGLLTIYINAINQWRDTSTVSDVSMKVGLEVKAEKTNYMLTSHHQHHHHQIYGLLLGPGLCFNFVIFITQTVGVLGRGMSPSQGRYLHIGQHKHRINACTNIRDLSGIRTHDPSVRANEDSTCLRPRGHRDRPSPEYWKRNNKLFENLPHTKYEYSGMQWQTRVAFTANLRANYIRVVFAAIQFRNFWLAIYCLTTWSEIYQTLCLSLDPYGCETWYLALRETFGLRVP